MRLIDADKIDFNEVFVGESEFAQDTRNAAQMLINKQPTAYDVDKVVEELKHFAVNADVALKERGTFNRNIIGINNAIEIVKGGGIDAW